MYSLTLLVTMALGPVAPPYVVEVLPIALPYVEEADQHSGQPITVPKDVPHSYRGWGACACLMCLGQHAVNMHRLTTAELDKIGYRNWSAYHAKLHDAMGTAKQSGCEAGNCQPARSARGLLRRWRGY